MENSWGSGLTPMMKDFLAGAIGGVAGVVAGSPLDTIRIRMQQRKTKLGGTLATWRGMVGTEGPGSLFKGMAYPVTTIAFQSAVVFQAYGIAARYLAEKEDSKAPLSYSNVFAAGCLAGTIQTFIITPVDLLKIRLQLQKSNHGQPNYVGPIRLLRRILTSEGIPGLYRGLGVTLIRDIPSHGVYFGVYEFCRELLEPGSRVNGSENPLALLGAGGVAGVLSWLSVYPFDVIKSRLQAYTKVQNPYQGWVDCARRSYREEGGVVFWRGLAPTLGRAFLVNAAVFSSYELVLKLLRNPEERPTEDGAGLAAVSSSAVLE